MVGSPVRDFLGGSHRRFVPVGCDRDRGIPRHHGRRRGRPARALRSGDRGDLDHRRYRAEPTRNAIHAIFSREDDLRLPGLEEAITRDLRMGLMDAVDLAIFEGDSTATGTAADITGLQTAASVVEKTVTQTNKVKGPETLQALVELIDGKHAEGAGDLRIVASVGANTLWMTTVANSTAENQTIAQFLMASGMTWGVRGDISAVSTANAFGAFVGRGRGIDGAAVAPVWDSGELIRDPYTAAAKGEVVLTLNYFWNFGLPRPSNFARLKFVT